MLFVPLAALVSGFGKFQFPRQRRRTNPASLRQRQQEGRLCSAEVESDVATNIPIPSVVDDDDTAPKQQRRVAVLVCPAQFCVPNDYIGLLDNLHSSSTATIEASTVVPLGRTDWIKVARQLPTRNFVEARLNVKETLDWYFQAMEDGLAQLFAEQAESGGVNGDDWSLCIVGHSIGGWIARAYLGGLSHSSSAVYRMALERCSSLVTLGTPHTSPDTALVDQTRGLLRAIEETPACSPRALQDTWDISITCVCSNGIRGGLFNDDDSNSGKGNGFAADLVESAIATGSYLPLTGQWGNNDDDEDDASRGDGIVPLSLAYLEEPAKRVILDKCSETGKAIRHLHVVPTPWNLWDGKAPSIALAAEDYPSYVSKGVVKQWAQYIV